MWNSLVVNANVLSTSCMSASSQTTLSTGQPHHNSFARKVHKQQHHQLQLQQQQDYRENGRHRDSDTILRACELHELHEKDLLSIASPSFSSLASPTHFLNSSRYSDSSSCPENLLELSFDLNSSEADTQLSSDSAVSSVSFPSTPVPRIVSDQTLTLSDVQCGACELYGSRIAVLSADSNLLAVGAAAEHRDSILRHIPAAFYNHSQVQTLLNNVPIVAVSGQLDLHGVSGTNTAPYCFASDPCQHIHLYGREIRGFFPPYVDNSLLLLAADVNDFRLPIYIGRPPLRPTSFRGMAYCRHDCVCFRGRSLPSIRRDTVLADDGKHGNYRLHFIDGYLTVKFYGLRAANHSNIANCHLKCTATTCNQNLARHLPQTPDTLTVTMTSCDQSKQAKKKHKRSETLALSHTETNVSAHVLANFSAANSDVFIHSREQTVKPHSNNGAKETEQNMKKKGRMTTFGELAWEESTTQSANKAVVDLTFASNPIGLNPYMFHTNSL